MTHSPHLILIFAVRVSCGFYQISCMLKRKHEFRPSGRSRCPGSAVGNHTRWAHLAPSPHSVFRGTTIIPRPQPADPPSQTHCLEMQHPGTPTDGRATGRCVAASLGGRGDAWLSRRPTEETEGGKLVVTQRGKNGPVGTSRSLSNNPFP